MGRETTARQFPDASWAWPAGDLDLLLIAAAAHDRTRAIAAARDWFAANDIDEASFAGCRFLLVIASRFGKALADLPEYPCLVGLQRMLWTKSRIAIREALPAFEAMAARGIRQLLIKGAARIALYHDDQKSRVSHDTRYSGATRRCPRWMC